MSYQRPSILNHSIELNAFCGGYLLKLIRVFPRKSELSRPAYCYEPEDVRDLQELALQLTEKLAPALPKSCFQLKGHGGPKAAARQIDSVIQTGNYRYVCRSDARSYYDSIDTELKQEKHPDKTFIGRLSHGFDALGYPFSEEDGLTGLSAAAVQRFGARIVERYAQHESRASLLHYVTRSLGWQFRPEHAASDMPGSKPKIQTKNTNNNNNENETTKQIHAVMEKHKTNCTCSNT